MLRVSQDLRLISSAASVGHLKVTLLALSHPHSQIKEIVAIPHWKTLSSVRHISQRVKHMKWDHTSTYKIAAASAVEAETLRPCPF